MGTKTIPSYLSEEILKLTDKLIEAGVFSSRSEALRELAEACTRNYEKLTRIANSIEELLKMEKKTGETPNKARWRYRRAPQIKR